MRIWFLSHMPISLINEYADVYSGGRILNFDLHLHPYFVNGSYEYSGETAHVHTLPQAFIEQNTRISKISCAGHY